QTNKFLKFNTMKKRIFFIVPVILIAVTIGHTQDKFFTKTGKIFFKCTKPSSPEKIEGTNKSITCVLDTKTGNIQFAVLMKGFEFERALMQEHFNENYAETDKFPKSEFKGQVLNNTEINYAKAGSYSARVKGSLQIHGETKNVETTGTITIRDGKPELNATFQVLLSDYKISIPSLVSDKISNTVDIAIEGKLDPLK
ncbi:MAG: YceI family protein, partial [Bacteroidota bacterium]